MEPITPEIRRSELPWQVAWQETIVFLKAGWQEWWPYFLVLWLLELSGMGVERLMPEKEFSRHMVDVLLAILQMWMQVTLIIHVFSPPQKDEGFLDMFWEGACATPAFLLYSFLMVLRMLMGFVLLVIPGIYVATIYYMTPYLAVVLPDYDKSYFKRSHSLVKGRGWEFFLAIMVANFLYVVTWVTYLLPVSPLRTGLDLFLSPLGAFILMASYLFTNFLLRAMLADTPEET